MPKPFGRAIVVSAKLPPPDNLCNVAREGWKNMPFKQNTIMKRNILLAAALLAAGTLLADSKDDVAAAAKALGDKDNYSWKSTLDMGANAQFRPGNASLRH